MVSFVGARRSAVLVTAAVAAIVLGAAPAVAAARYPVTGNIVEGAAKAVRDPAASPAGVNVASCRLSAAHPLPVVLVDGTFANMIDDWSGLGPTLANAGYCVYSTPLGADPHHFVQTIGHVPASAAELASFVRTVLSRTGARQVDLVGHSQGGMLAEYYVKELGGSPYVHDLVGLSPTSHGTTLDGLESLADAIPGARKLVEDACPACTDQLSKSAVIRTLDDGPITRPGVTYTIIETHNETVVTPAGSSFVHEDGVHNEWVQDYCASDVVDHVDLPYDRTVQRLVANALDPAHAVTAHCG